MGECDWMEDVNEKTVKVTKRDIQRGERINSRKCPVALALRRLTTRDIWVGISTIWERGFKRKEVKLPKAAQVFIERFDDERAVKPFTFKITLP